MDNELQKRTVSRQVLGEVLIFEFDAISVINLILFGYSYVLVSGNLQCTEIGK